MNGILFKPEMIRAIREGRKSQTRRLIKSQPESVVPDTLQPTVFYRDGDPSHVLKPRYLPGETVYVKEAIVPYDKHNPWSDPRRIYTLDGAFAPSGIVLPKTPSPMFMKAEYARTFLKIVGVRAERLQAITEEDCFAEGIENMGEGVGRTPSGMWAIAKICYAALWDSINKKPGTRWGDDPFVWVFTFKEVPHD